MGQKRVVIGSRKDGSPISVEFSVNETWLNGKRLFVSVLRDNTDRKASEDTLRASEERHRFLFDCNPESMWVCDAATHHFLAVNQTAVRHYGYTHAEFLSMAAGDIEPEFATERSPTANPGHARLTQHRLASGETRQVEVTASTIEFDGRPAWLMMCIDVTERKQLETQLRQAQKLESIGQLAAGIAHEINTPIQYIGDNTKFLASAFGDLGGVLDLYRTAATDPARLALAEQAAEVAELGYLLEEAPRAIGQTLEGVQHVARIVKAMKEFAHPGTEEKVPLDLNQSLQTVIAVSRNEWKYVAEVVTDLDPDLPPISGFPGELNQVFLNLVVNAAHAIQANPVARERNGTITISTQWKDNLAEVRVADTGCGIPEAIRGRIFDPFFTTKPVGQGTGQGLTIAHTIVVQKHGGSIGVESEVGTGATFVIRLPVGRAIVSRAAHSRMATGEHQPPEPQKG